MYQKCFFEKKPADLKDPNKFAIPKPEPLKTGFLIPPLIPPKGAYP